MKSYASKSTLSTKKNKSIEHTFNLMSRMMAKKPVTGLEMGARKAVFFPINF
jgi:hypothetical protein